MQGIIPTLLGHLGVIRTTGVNNGFGLLMDAAGSGNNSLGLAVGGATKAAFSWDNSRNFLGFANFIFSQNDFSLRLNSDGSLTFNDGVTSAERFIVNANGNVGIGTPSPTFSLDVVGNINTSTQLNIGGNRVLSTAGVKNVYAGVSTGPGIVTTGSCCNSFFGTLTGTANTTGRRNSFFGDEVGSANTTGNDNSFFGVSAGIKNISGSFNSFFGSFAGVENMIGGGNSFFGANAGEDSTGSNNSFFGKLAGNSNTMASQNSFFGAEAGLSNTTGINNSFFGYQAGKATTNSAADNNSFFGTFAGTSNTTGSNNSFIGEGAGATNTTGTNNSSLGFHADSADGLTNATALGFRAFAGQSNSLVLGSINGVNGALTDTKVGIGTTTPLRHLHVKGAGDQEIAIESSDSGGLQWTLQSSRGDSPFNGEFQIIDRTAGKSRFSILGESGNVGIGTTTPRTKLHVAASIASSVGTDDEIPLIDEHVAFIENTVTGQGQSVLALKIGPDTTPISTNNFITFYDADSHSIGAIQGNGSNSVSLVGQGNDYAEWLPRLNSTEQMQPGEIVGLVDGHITKNTRRASQVMALSTGSIVAGNDPGKDARSKYA
ncbi:MAG: hypothetical protein DMF60_00915, partial [Acidobacteria bacterium]